MKKIKNIFLSKKNLKRDIFIVIIAGLISFSAVSAGNLDPSGVPGATMYTLGDIYEKLTTNQSANEEDHEFKPNADPASSFHTLKEIYESIPTIEADRIKEGSAYLGVSGTLLPSGGTADISTVLAGETFFGAGQADWNLQSGTMANIGQQVIVPGTSDQIITLGYHDGTGYVTGDVDLIAGNIKSGITLFGVAGDSNVVDTSSGDSLTSDVLLNKIAWIDGTEITGTYDASELTIGTVKSGTSFGTGLVGEYPSSSYPLAGDTGATDAGADEICDGYEAWEKDGNLLTGTLSPSALAIGSGNTICGVTGTLLKDEKNGSAGSSVEDYEFYTKELGGVDDYNSNDSQPSDSYTHFWTQCDASNDYCDTNDETACSGDVCKIDDGTGVVWSDYLDSGTDHTWFWANNCFEPGTTENPGTCTSDGDDACRCVKKTDDKTGCESLGDGSWELPYQKELMQAYIDGSWGNLIHAGSYFWSATTFSYATQNAWKVNLSNGYLGSATKTSTYDSRCVHR